MLNNITPLSLGAGQSGTAVMVVILKEAFATRILYLNLAGLYKILWRIMLGILYLHIRSWLRK